MSFRIELFCFDTIKLVEILHMTKLWGTYCSSETYKKINKNYPVSCGIKEL